MIFVVVLHFNYFIYLFSSKQNEINSLDEKRNANVMLKYWWLVCLCGRLLVYIFPIHIVILCMDIFGLRTGPIFIIGYILSISIFIIVIQSMSMSKRNIS